METHAGQIYLSSKMTRSPCIFEIEIPSQTPRSISFDSFKFRVLHKLSRPFPQKTFACVRKLVFDRSQSTRKLNLFSLLRRRSSAMTPSKLKRERRAPFPPEFNIGAFRLKKVTLPPSPIDFCVYIQPLCLSDAVQSAYRLFSDVEVKSDLPAL